MDNKIQMACSNITNYLFQIGRSPREGAKAASMEASMRHNMKFWRPIEIKNVPHTILRRKAMKGVQNVAFIALIM